MMTLHIVHDADLTPVATYSEHSLSDALEHAEHIQGVVYTCQYAPAATIVADYRAPPSTEPSA